MYIDPFWCGVGITLFAVLVGLSVWGAIISNKK